MKDTTIQLIANAVLALPTIAFSGVVAFWTWRRDQERIRVDLDASIGTPLNGQIVVTNLSLYPITIHSFSIKTRRNWGLRRNLNELWWIPCRSWAVQWPQKVSKETVVVWSIDSHTKQTIGFGAETPHGDHRSLRITAHVTTSANKKFRSKTYTFDHFIKKRLQEDLARQP